MLRCLWLLLLLAPLGGRAQEPALSDLCHLLDYGNDTVALYGQAYFLGFYKLDYTSTGDRCLVGLLGDDGKPRCVLTLLYEDGRLRWLAYSTRVAAHFTSLRRSVVTDRRAVPYRMDQPEGLLQEGYLLRPYAVVLQQSLADPTRGRVLVGHAPPAKKK